jgi:hypothetical protein
VTASVHRRLPMPIASVLSSNVPSPRFHSRYFRPPLFAYSKLSGMIRVVSSFQRSTPSGQ